ncbi:MAG: hypothetical protein GY906_27385 [bacterium]|nr:hypothetical protein [bacterium]
MNHEPKIVLIRRKPLRDILDEAMRLTRKNIVQMLPAVAIPISVFTVIFSISQIAVSPTPNGSNPFDGSNFGLLMLFFLGGFVLYMAATLIANTALLGAVVWRTVGEPRSMSQAWLWALTPKVLGTSFLVALLCIIGFLFCFLPGILFAVIFGLALVVVAAEGIFGTGALKRSRDLINHNPERRAATHPAGKVFVIMFVGYLLSYLASMVVQAPLAIVQQFLTFRSMANIQADGGTTIPTAIWWLQVPQGVLGAFATEAVALYVFFATTLLYLDLRGTKEGEDLETEMDALGVPRPTTESDHQ